MSRRLACVALLAGAALVLSASTAHAGADAPTVRITSPLGRTGVPGVLRVVAQVTTDPAKGVVPVPFFVDGPALGHDPDRPTTLAKVTQTR